MRNRVAAIASVLLLCACQAGWASEFADGFESYSAGLGIHGQGGWKGWDNVPAADGLASNRYAHTDRQSAEILGTTDLVHEFNLTGGKWIFTAWQYIPSGSSGATYFILMNTYADGGPYDWSIQTQYDMTAGTVIPYSGAVGETARIVLDQWVQIKFVIDLDANTFEEYYNGAQIAAGVWDDDAHGTLQAVDLYGNGASAVYYDDIRIDSGATPAPNCCFPRPAYDSGWIATPFGSPSKFAVISLKHGLGGNADDYVVDLQMSVSGIAGPNRTNQGLGTVFSYSYLTSTDIQLTAPLSAVDLVTSLRVRIWVYSSDTNSSSGQPKRE
ncbi:MAG: hypothetical protein GX448_07970 [Planctomycetes bacterium]|nr:hypothetical protein [Planctomycetota bacterium]